MQDMEKHVHNGPGFMYKVSWRKAGDRERWNSSDVESAPLLIQDAGTFAQYEIKVQAVNSLGVGPEPDLEIGRSGEDSTSLFLGLLGCIPAWSGQLTLAAPQKVRTDHGLRLVRVRQTAVVL